MDFRHEWKHEINYSDMLILRQRLKAVMKPDENAVDGKYFIRSLYFDNISDKALREKIDGVNCREKFRIRYYNNDTSLIHLEKKSKINGLGNKQSANLSAEEAQKIVDFAKEFGFFSELTAEDAVNPTPITRAQMATVISRVIGMEGMNGSEMPFTDVPDWAKDTVSKVEPPPDALDDFSRLSPTNFFNVNGDKIEIQTDLGGTFALIDLNGVTLFKTRIKKGLTTLKVPEKAQNQHWIATLNGKMLSR